MKRKRAKIWSLASIPSCACPPIELKAMIYLAAPFVDYWLKILAKIIEGIRIIPDRAFMRRGLIIMAAASLEEKLPPLLNIAHVHNDPRVIHALKRKEKKVKWYTDGMVAENPRGLMKTS